MGVRPRILYLCTGYRYLRTGNVNVGDNAQQQHGLLLLAEHCPGAEILQVANSVNEGPVVTGPSFSTAIVGYIIGPAAVPGRRLRSLGRSLLLLWNARRAARGREPVALSGAGQVALAEIRRSSLVFCAGSGNFHDGYMTSVAFLWSVILLSARLLGIPVVMLGQQVGPMDRWLSRAIAGPVLRRVNFLGVRESQSLATARALAVPPDRLHFTGDEGWYLPPAPGSEVSASLARLGLQDGFIAVQLRYGINSPFQPWLAGFACLCDALSAATGRPLVLVPFSYADRDDDRQTHRELRALIRSPCHALDLGPDARLTKGVLARASIAVGVANHFCVFAASVGVPTVGLYAAPYMQHKLRGVADQHAHVLALDAGALADPAALAKSILEHAAAHPRERSGADVTQRPPGYLGWVRLLPARADG